MKTFIELDIVTEEVKLYYTKDVTPQITYSNNSLFYLKNQSLVH